MVLTRSSRASLCASVRESLLIDRAIRGVFFRLFGADTGRRLSNGVASNVLDLNIETNYSAESIREYQLIGNVLSCLPVVDSDSDAADSDYVPSSSDDDDDDDAYGTEEA